MILEITISIILICAVIIYLKNKAKKESKKQKLLDELNDYLHKNYDSRMDNFITVFESRLLTLEDEENVHFYNVGIIEYELFVKNLTKYGNELKEEINTSVKIQHALASDLGVLHEFVFTVENYISSLVTNYTAKAMLLLTDKLLEINTKNTEANAETLSQT
jgi:uncharacterized protein (DUF2164 family)